MALMTMPLALGMFDASVTRHWLAAHPDGHARPQPPQLRFVLSDTHAPLHSAAPASHGAAASAASVPDSIGGGTSATTSGVTTTSDVESGWLESTPEPTSGLLASTPTPESSPRTIGSGRSPRSDVHAAARKARVSAPRALRVFGWIMAPLKTSPPRRRSPRRRTE